MTNLYKHPLLAQCYDVMRAIEECGASEKLTHAITLAGNLMRAIDAHVDATEAERVALNAELGSERMRLAACSAVALADTPDSAKEARQMHPDYRSAACDDVARRVDECMELRDQRDELRKSLRVAADYLDLIYRTYGGAAKGG